MATPSETAIQITLKMITSETVPLTVKPSDTIEDTIHCAAGALQASFGFDVSGGGKIRLIFSGREIFATEAFQWTDGCGTKTWADVGVGISPVARAKTCVEERSSGTLTLASDCMDASDEEVR